MTDIFSWPFKTYKDVKTLIFAGDGFAQTIDAFNKISEINDKIKSINASVPSATFRRLKAIAYVLKIVLDMYSADSLSNSMHILKQVRAIQCINNIVNMDPVTYDSISKHVQELLDTADKDLTLEMVINHFATDNLFYRMVSLNAMVPTESVLTISMETVHDEMAQTNTIALLNLKIRELEKRIKEQESLIIVGSKSVKTNLEGAPEPVEKATFYDEDSVEKAEFYDDNDVIMIKKEEDDDSTESSKSEDEEQTEVVE